MLSQRETVSVSGKRCSSRSNSQIDSSVQKIRKKSDRASVFTNSQPSTSKEKPKKNLETEISQVSAADGLKSEKQIFKELCLTRKLTSGKVYGVVLPLVLDSSLKPFKQPILIRFNIDLLKEFGFSLPFNAYMKEKENYFEIKFQGTIFTAQIIAIGDTPLDVKTCLRKNMKENPTWRKLNSIIGNGNGVMNIVHKPLKSDTDFPSQKVLGPSALKQIFGYCERQEKNKEQIQKKGNSHSTGSLSKEKESEDSNCGDKDQQSIYADESSNHPEPNMRNNMKKATGKVEIINESQQPKVQVDTTETETKIERLKAIIEEIDRKKITLSERDTTGSLIFTIIKAIECIADSLELKNTRFEKSSYIVPEKDKTYKDQDKNQIFIEGTIQLDLSSYEFALRNSRPEQPASLAYQIVHFCFPKQYYSEVTLGKKFLSNKDIDLILKKREQGIKVKLPLQYVWGFKDPYQKPLVGDSDQDLGLERIRAFINHIFRKSEIFRYSQEMEYKVRNRISKEISFLNSKKVSSNSSDDESHSEEIETRKDSQREEDNSHGKDSDEKIINDKDSETDEDDPWNIYCFDP